MLLYHSTLNSYAPGELVLASSPTTFYLDAVAEIERIRPSNLPSRLCCVFATNDLEFCYYFALRQKWDPSQIKIYEVEMDAYHKAPIAIVHPLQRRIEKGSSTGKLANEYWHPTEPWKFWEFFGPAMTVRGQVSAPNINETAMFMKYQGDSDHASNL